MEDSKIKIIADEKEIAQTISILVSNYITENYGELMKYLSRVKKSKVKITYVLDENSIDIDSEIIPK